MKVLIACAVTPFSATPDERRAASLCTQLAAAGHEAEVLRVPFTAAPPERLPSQLVMMRSLESWNVDHLVALDLPSALLRHPRKSLWIGAGQVLPDGAAPALRALLASAAAGALAESRSAFCSSYAAGSLLRETLGLQLPTLPLPPQPAATKPGDYIFAAPPRDPADTRLLEALAQAGPDVRLLLAGPPAAPGQEQMLRAAAAALGVAARVRFDLRLLTEQETGDYLACAVAVACIGGADDSGLALAGAGAGKALIAGSGSDNAAQIVRAHLTGWRSPADGAGLAAVLDEAWTCHHRTLAYGAQARGLLQLAGWPHIVESLLA